MSMEQKLSEVLALCELASPGEFSVEYGTNIMAGDGYSATSLSGPRGALKRNEANATAMVAALNFLREYGRSLGGEA